MVGDIYFKDIKVILTQCKKSFLASMIIKPQTFQAQEIFRRQRREFLQLFSAGRISNPSGANQDNHLFSVSGIKRQCGRFSG